MGERITSLILIIRRLPIFRIFQRTLGMLMPIAIIGSYFKLLRDAVFSPDSFIYNILNFDETMPDKIWYAGSFIWNAPRERHAARVYEQPFISVFAWLENVNSPCQVLHFDDWDEIEQSLSK